MWTSLWNQKLLLLPWGVAVIASLVAAVIDVRQRRIPNLLTLPLWAGGLVWGGWSGGLSGLGDSLAGCVILMLPFVVLFLVAGGGAGDAKLMGGLGAWLGVRKGLLALAGVSAAAILTGVILALWQRRLREVAGNLAGMIRAAILFVVSRGRLRPPAGGGQDGAGRLTMPYAVAILAGVSAAAAGALLWHIR